MSAIVDFRTEVIHRYVLELRYEFGQIYWDRAGRVAKTILGGMEGWDFDAIDNNRCQISRRDQNMAFSFGHQKFDLSQIQTADVPKLLSSGEFGKVAASLAKTVVEILELQFFPRIGFRVWQLYGTDTSEKAHELIRNMKLMTLDAGIATSLGKLSEVSHRLVVDRGKHMLRIAVAPFEQQIELTPSIVRATKASARKGSQGQNKILLDQLKAKKTIQTYPQFGVLFDVDAYMDDPPYPDELSISDFIGTAFEDIGIVKKLVLEAAGKP